MTETKRKLQIRDNETTPEGIERLFDSSFYANFSKTYVDQSCTDYCDEYLHQALISASENYVDILYEFNVQIPENLENAVLERVNNSIWELYNSLLELIDVGQADKKLTTELQSYSDYPPGHSARILYDLQKQHPDQPAFYFRDMLMDLLWASERAQNIQEKFDDDDATMIFLNLEEKKTAENERWRKRRAESRLSKSSPLLSFLSVWKQFWEKYSHIPFTEGRYLSELGTTKSQAVDALEEIFEVLDTSVTRSAIVSAVKKAKHD